MPVDDRTRMNLHRKLEAALGREEADTLMAHLPPVTWNEVATKEGVATLGTTLRAEMQTLRAEMQTFGAEMQTLRAELQTSSAGLRADFTEQTNRQIKWLVTFAAAWTSLLVTLVRFIP